MDCDKVRLSETKIETQDPEKRNLDGVTVTVTGTFDFATLTVRTEHDEMTITMGYPVRKAIAIPYTFAQCGDSFSVRALLSENGVEGAFDGITVHEGDGDALAILERDGDCFVGAIDAFDRIVLRVNIDGGRPVDLTLQMAGPAGDDPTAPIEPDDMLRVRDGVTFFGVADKAHVSATAEPVEASVKNGTVLAAYELRMIPDEPTKRDLRT